MATTDTPDDSDETLCGVDWAFVQDRARQLVDGSQNSSETTQLLAGIRHMHHLSLSIGLPTPRILFGAMVDVATAKPNRKNIWRRRLQLMSEITEQGCIQVDLPGRASAHMTFYLILDECGPDHDLTAELDKLYTHLPEKSRGAIREHLSTLIYLGRAAYSQMAQKMEGVLTEIGRRIRIQDGAPPFDFRVLEVDPQNTTLYVAHMSDRRVGIFVRRDCDPAVKSGSR